jgi:hypothetical protein
VKELLGRTPGQFGDNIVRERFNDLIRKTYDGREPVFDLARHESSTTTFRATGGHEEGMARMAVSTATAKTNRSTRQRLPSSS